MKKIKEIYSYYVLYITLKENEFLSFLKMLMRKIPISKNLFFYKNYFNVYLGT